MCIAFSIDMLVRKNITFFLVRHGEAECNVRGVMSSAPETTVYHLTDGGRHQAESVAQQLQGRGVGVIFASPFTRTRETAEIIGAVLDVSVILEQRLEEVGGGIYNSGAIALFEAKYPKPESRLAPDLDDGVESFSSVRKRLTEFLKDIEKDYGGKTVVVVSHGDPLEQLHGILTDESPGVSSLGWHPALGSCTEVTWEIR